ncbi:MAG TPA: amidohydrolase family protein, partial [Geminicoccus sp.]|uniref:amidohydrolase family protein n=1 Tax=Geminicoccus sp. TaxID=2024832 RepID=UPI002CD17299
MLKIVGDGTPEGYTALLLEPVDERLEVAEAVHANRMGAVHQLGREDRIGSLEAGKPADLVVLEQDRSLSNPRPDRPSTEPDHGGSEVDEAGEVDGSSVVAGGEAAEWLEPVAASFDAVAVLIGGVIVRDSN